MFLTWCPVEKEDDVDGILIPRQVGDERGQPPQAAGLDAHLEADDAASGLPYLHPQPEHRPAVELEFAPAVRVEASIIFRLHVPDRPPPLHLHGCREAEELLPEGSWGRRLQE